MTAKELYEISIWNKLPITLTSAIERDAKQGYTTTTFFKEMCPEVFQNEDEITRILKRLGFKVEYETGIRYGKVDDRLFISWEEN